MFTGLLTLQTPRADLAEAVRATLPLCGATWLERTMRLATLAGIGRLIVLAERLTPEMTQCLDACRASGQRFELAGSALDLVQLLDRDEAVVLIEEGVVTSQDLLETLIGRYGGSAQSRGLVAGWPTGHAMADEAYRLGQTMASAGLAVLPAALVSRIARGLGDWDPVQTFIQTAWREDGAELLDLSRQPETVTTIWRRLATARDADTATSMIAGLTAGPGASAIDRLTLEPLVEVLMPFAVLAPLRGPLLSGLVAVTGVLAAIVIAAGWLRPGGLLVLAALLAGEVANRLQAVRLEPAADRMMLGWIRLGSLVLTLLALAAALSHRDWSALALCGWLAVALAVRAMTLPVLAATAQASRILALDCTPWALTLVLAAGALLGMPRITLTLVTLWASGVALGSVRHVVRQADIRPSATDDPA